MDNKYQMLCGTSMRPCSGATCVMPQGAFCGLCRKIGEPMEFGFKLDMCS